MFLAIVIHSWLVMRWAPSASHIALASVCVTPAMGEPRGLDITFVGSSAVYVHDLFQS